MSNINYNLYKIFCTVANSKSYTEASEKLDFTPWCQNRYMIKGFTMDNERLKGNGGGNYWRELLARIKDIRSSEKVLYRQVHQE